VKLKSEKARRDKLAHLDKEIRKYEERHPHFPAWLELLKQHSGQGLEALGTWSAWPRWPEPFYRATGVACPAHGFKKWRLPDEYAFFCYVEALAEREKVEKAPLRKKPRASRPKPDPSDEPTHSGKRPPRW
jgi:hypothetical protein